MDTLAATEAFAALAQKTRLETFRLLVRYEPEGLAAGELARRLDVPHNTLSAHLGVLSRSGLVTAERRGRTIVYRAALDAMGTLVEFLVHDCCADSGTVCQSLVPLCNDSGETT